MSGVGLHNREIGISVFFPILNDWGTIGSLVTCVVSTLESLTDNFEIILVDDGSGVPTKQVLRELEKRFPCVRVVTHERNRGYGGAVQTGIRESCKELIFYTDADAQYDPRELGSLVQALEDGVDVVNGYKIKRNDPWYRIVIGEIYRRFVKVLFNIPIRDVDCDFRLFRRRIFDVVSLEAETGVICTEMIHKISQAGFGFREVPVHHYWRTSGKSQFFNFSRVFRSILGLVSLWWSVRRG